MKAPSLFFELLSSLTSDHRKSLLHFIKTPGLKHSKELEVLLSVILKDSNFQEVDGPKLLKKYPVGSDAWNQVKGKMLEVIRQYLFVVRADEASFSSSVTLLEYYALMDLKRNLNKSFSKISKPQKGEIDFNYHLSNYHASRVNLIFTKGEYNQTDYLEEMEKQLDFYYLQNKLLCQTEKLNRLKIINENEYNPIIKLPANTEELLKSSIGGTLYLYISQMLEESSESRQIEYFHQVHNFLKENIRILTPDFRRDVYNHLLNFCNRQTKKGNLDFARIYLNLVKELEQKKLLTQNGKINIHYLYNIIVMSVILEDLKTADKYLGKYRDHTVPASDQIIILIEAIVHLHKDTFEDIQFELTNQPQYKSYYHCIQELLFIKHFIETETLLPATSKINALRIWLAKDSSIQEKRKKPIKNFLEFADKLVISLDFFSDNGTKAKHIMNAAIKDCLPFDSIWFKTFKKKVAKTGYPHKDSKKKS